MVKSLRSWMVVGLACLIGPCLALSLVVFLNGAQPVRAQTSGPDCYVAKNVDGSDDSSWNNAYTDLQAALDDATCTEIWVATGVYTPGIQQTDTFTPGTGVALYGGFAGTETDRSQRDWEANPTVLSGDIGGDDTTDSRDVVTDTGNISGTNAYHVVSPTGDAMLDGFIITAGQANGTTVATYKYGGGMYNDSSSPALTNITFSGNTASNGGGMYNSVNSSPTLTNITFSGNNATDSGGGMYNDSSSPALTNITFSGNNASYGGGMFNFVYSSPTLTNITFSGNNATIGGGGMYNFFYSSPTLTNCILWGDSAVTGPEIYNVSSSPAISYSIIQGSGGSGGSWDIDPRFVDPGAGDLRLRYDSPAIDAGDTTAVSGIATDLAGNPRVMGIDVDMGAYEVTQVTLSGPDSGPITTTMWLELSPVCDRLWFTDTSETPPSSVAVSLTHETPTGLNAATLLPRRYGIAATGGSFEAKLELCYDDAELASAGLDAADLVVLSASDGVSTTHTSVVNKVNQPVTALGVTGFSTWGLGASGDPTAVGIRGLGALAPSARVGLGTVLLVLPLVIAIVIPQRRRR